MKRLILLPALLLTGCPEPQKPAVEPEPTSFAEDMPGEPEPVVEKPAPEAGLVRVGAAMMVGGQGISETASSEASKAFLASFEEGKSHFRQCYGKALANNPSLSGDIDVRLVLSKDGSIYDLKLAETEIDEPAMVECVVQAFRKLKYAPLGDGELFSVTAPLKFSPE